MNIVLLGPPGAGKGTQAEVLAKSYNLLHVSTGEMLREAVKNGTDAGSKAKGFMDKGELVPDSIVTKIVTDAIMNAKGKNGFILDGFPRNVSQGEELERQLAVLKLKLDMVIYFNTSEPVAISRLTGRRVCTKCNGNFHIKNRPPKMTGICDKCGSALIQRNDDKEDTIKNRLVVYSKQTAPLLDFYKQKGFLREVKGDLDVDALFVILKELFVKEKLA